MYAARRYRKMQAETASREEVLLMLFDGALRFVDEAVEAFEANDIATAGGRIGKVIAIVAELQSSLDHSRAPELCQTLDALYSYISQQLLQANRKRSVDTLREARALIASLHETWREAADIVRQEAMEASPSLHARRVG